MESMVNGVSGNEQISSSEDECQESFLPNVQKLNIGNIYNGDSKGSGLDKHGETDCKETILRNVQKLNTGNIYNGDSKGYNRKDVIDAMNYLQQKLAASGQPQLKIPLPQIVAVGGQSAGKSSVIESFVRKEFLPRGKGTVTRRPTIIQMIPAYEDYAIFAHKPGVRYTDFSKVKEEIVAETARHPGPSGFTSDPITVEIYSPRVLKLTIVDLPGLIENVDDGDSEDCIEELRNMVLRYIEPKESLILAVTSATEDFLNSQALKIAREVDPEKKRTIGVITKLDCEGSEDYKKVLENRRIYLTMGYVGVVNRNQKEIDQKKDFDFIFKKEQEFFANHPRYKHLKNVMGIPYLVKMLQKILRVHIKQFLPQIRSDVSKEVTELRKELRNFSKRLGSCNVFNGAYDRQDYVIQLILNFAEDISMQLFGNSLNIETKKFSAGTMISFKFATEVHKKLSLTIQPDEAEAQFIIVNVLGIRTAISVPSMALDALNSTLLQQFKEPMEESVRCIREILELAIVERAKTMDKYPSLKNEILHQIRQCIETEAESTQEKLIDHIEASMCYINYNHPDFDISSCSSISPNAGPLKLWDNSGTALPDYENAASAEENDASARETSGLPSTETIMKFLRQNESNKKNLLYSTATVMKNIEYVQKQMTDLAIKYIINFLIIKVMKFIKTELLSKVLRSHNFASLAEDCDNDFSWKEETEIMCQLLQDVLEAIQDF